MAEQEGWPPTGREEDQNEPEPRSQAQGTTELS